MLLGTPSRVTAAGSLFPTGVDAEAVAPARPRRRPDGDPRRRRCATSYPARPGCSGRRGGSTSSPASTTRRRSCCTAPAPSRRRSPGPPLGAGYAHELIEVTECLRAGRTESAVMPLADTLAVQSLLGQAAEQLGVRHAEDPTVLRRPAGQCPASAAPASQARPVASSAVGTRVGVPPARRTASAKCTASIDRGAPGVVVEVDEDVLVRRPGGREAVGPELQRLRPVAPVLEAVCGSAGSPSRWCATAAPPAAPRGRPSTAPRRTLQQGADLVGPPGLVPRLDGHPDAGGELRQALAEQVGVGLQRGRELQQDRVELVPEPGRAPQQPADRLLGLAQPLDVRQEAGWP